MVGLGVLACALATMLYLRHEQIEALDQGLERSAKYLILSWASSPDETKRRALLEACLHTGPTRRLIEMVGAGGRVVFRSPELVPEELGRFRKGRRTLERSDGRYRVVTVAREAQRIWLAGSLKEVDQDAWERAFAVLPALPVLIGLALGGGWWIARKALFPIHLITDAAETITAAGLDQRLPAPRVKDDLGRLQVVLNGMFDRLEQSFGQAQRFSADASHELKTPVTVLRAGLEDLFHSADLNPAQQRAVADLLEQTSRLSRIIEGLLLLSRADAGKLALDLQALNVAELIQECLEDAQILADMKLIALEESLPERLWARVDAARFAQIVMNVVENAIKHNRRGGLVKVTAGEDAAAGTVIITVGNTGPAIPPEKAPHIFERFFRGSPTSETAGHGLGLSLARELARAHGGDLTLDRTSPGWTEFRISLPKCPPEAEARAAVTAAAGEGG